MFTYQSTSQGLQRNREIVQHFFAFRQLIKMRNFRIFSRNRIMQNFAVKTNIFVIFMCEIIAFFYEFPHRFLFLLHNLYSPKKFVTLQFIVKFFNLTFKLNLKKIVLYVFFVKKYKTKNCLKYLFSLQFRVLAA